MGPLCHRWPGEGNTSENWGAIYSLFLVWLKLNIAQKHVLSLNCFSKAVMNFLPVSSQISAPAIGWQHDLYVMLTRPVDTSTEQVLTEARQRHRWTWPPAEGTPGHFVLPSRHCAQVNRKSWNICITRPIRFQIKWTSWKKTCLSSPLAVFFRQGGH